MQSLDGERAQGLGRVINAVGRSQSRVFLHAAGSSCGNSRAETERLPLSAFIAVVVGDSNRVDRTDRVGSKKIKEVYTWSVIRGGADEKGVVVSVGDAKEGPCVDTASSMVVIKSAVI